MTAPFPVGGWRFPSYAGCKFLKYCRKSKPKMRFVNVTEELDSICWESRRKSDARSKALVQIATVSATGSTRGSLCGRPMGASASFAHA